MQIWQEQPQKAIKGKLVSIWNAFPGWAFSYNSWWDHQSWWLGWRLSRVHGLYKSLTLLFRGKCSPEHSGQNWLVPSCAGHEVECGERDKELVVHHLHSFPRAAIPGGGLVPWDAGAHLGGRSLREKSGLK